MPRLTPVALHDRISIAILFPDGATLICEEKRVA